MTKTYEQRLAEVAEEMFSVQFAVLAKENESTESFDIWKKSHNDEYTEALDTMFKPLAAIALKHMAEEWENGYTQVTVDEFIEMDRGETTTIQQHLINNGLIQPQKP